MRQIILIFIVMVTLLFLLSGCENTDEPATDTAKIQASAIEIDSLSSELDSDSLDEELGDLSLSDW